jgi:hypothetical protein
MRRGSPTLRRCRRTRNERSLLYAICYSAAVRNEDLIAFATRDWKAVAESKRQRWAEQRSHMTPAEALRVGDELRQHFTALSPDWPSTTDRFEDIAVHVRVAESLRRVGKSGR